jgi:hypothetical protein
MNQSLHSPIVPAIFVRVPTWALLVTLTLYGKVTCNVIAL